jgi:PTH1 family peptidyl-tRNA hydrolase
MKLIVGLGNPDKKYENTYHNVGFSFIDKFSARYDIKLKKRTCRSLTGEGYLEVNNRKEKIILAKPLTYMNLSGEAISLLLKKFKLDINDLIVVLDDIDLPIGTFRYRENGSAGTHNGLKNIVLNLNSTNFKRIRIGIGYNNENGDLADYVLSKIPNENLQKINEIIEKSLDLITNYLY